MVSFLRMRIMNNGLNQGSVISMRAVDQKQDYQLEWPKALRNRENVREGMFAQGMFAYSRGSVREGTLARERSRENVREGTLVS